MAGGDEIVQDSELAVALALAVKRLRARMREEAGATSTGLTLTQLAVLDRVLNQDPATPVTAASLAAAEHVTQQAIAQSLPALRAAGLIATRRDPTDGRKTPIVATAAGRRLRARLRENREAWLVRALDATLSARERATLTSAVALIERVAEVDLSPELELR